MANEKGQTTNKDL